MKIERLLVSPILRRASEMLREAQLTNACVDWPGHINASGYGCLTLWLGNDQRRYTPAHRYFYEMHAGPIADGLQVDHLCKNKRCFNPDHLEAVTPSQNSRRAFGTDTECRRGHLRATNTYVAPNGRRSCRPCNTISVAAYNRRSKAKAEAAS